MGGSNKKIRNSVDVKGRVGFLDALDSECPNILKSLHGDVLPLYCKL